MYEGDGMFFKEILIGYLANLTKREFFERARGDAARNNMKIVYEGERSDSSRAEFLVALDPERNEGKVYWRNAHLDHASHVEVTEEENGISMEETRYARHAVPSQNVDSVKKYQWKFSTQQRRGRMYPESRGDLSEFIDVRPVRSNN